MRSADHQYLCSSCIRLVTDVPPDPHPEFPTMDLMALPFVRTGEYKHLPICGAVYFAISPGRVCYIGMAENLRRRWYFHVFKKRLEEETDGRVAWVVQNNSLARELMEQEAIAYFKPLWNFGGGEYVKAPRVYNDPVPWEPPLMTGY